jgi:hypothetical protein
MKHNRISSHLVKNSKVNLKNETKSYEKMSKSNVSTQELKI